MKTLWYSATPECSSGYGNASRNMIKWLIEQDHWVAVATKHPMSMRWRTWTVPGTGKEIPIICGTNEDVINDAIMDAWGMDVCISMFDVGALAIGKERTLRRHIPWVPIDSQYIPTNTVKAIKDTPMQIAMSRHGEAELISAGFSPHYAPIGYDPEVFHHRSNAGQEFRETMTWTDGLKADEMYLIGSVGLNYAGDRKGFITLLRAFAEYRKKRPEARLYLHTQARKEKEGLCYDSIAESMGLMPYIAWPNQHRYWLGQYTEDDIAEAYSAMDIFVLPTLGEGFGMPSVEAQACGTPVCVTDNTTGQELTRSGCTIMTDSDDLMYTGAGTWRIKPKVSRVVEAIEYVRDRIWDRGDVAESVKEYAWPEVWENYWMPIMNEIEVTT